MKGLEEARRFYETFGRDMLHRDFPDFEGRVAVGLAGPGSGFGSSAGVSSAAPPVSTSRTISARRRS